MIATITLNPSIDQNIIVSGLVKDDANRALEILRYAGGKGVNVSKVVRELGGPTFAYSLEGGLTGEIWKKCLKTLDIPFYAMPVEGETRMNTILTDRHDGTQTRISAPGPHVNRIKIRRFVKHLLSVRPRPFLWALGGSLALGMKPSLYAEIVHALQKEGVPCILDADNEALRLGVKAKPFMIKPNEFEMERLVGKRLKTIRDYKEAGRALVDKGISTVVVSLGSKGALFITKTEAFHIPAPRVKVRSKVGAGDSLIGGFALGLYRKKSIRQAACLGIAASSSAVMREAPRLCLHKDVAPLLKLIHIKELV